MAPKLVSVLYLVQIHSFRSILDSFLFLLKEAEELLDDYSRADLNKSASVNFRLLSIGPSTTCVGGRTITGEGDSPSVLPILESFFANCVIFVADSFHVRISVYWQKNL